MVTILAYLIAGIFAFVAVVLMLNLTKLRKEITQLKAESEERSQSGSATAISPAATPAHSRAQSSQTGGDDYATTHGLFATLSHELRTPLNGVMGMAQLVKQDRQDERIDILESCAYHMQSVLHALVNYTKIQANWGKLPEYREWVNLHDLLEQTKRELSTRARTRGLKIAIDHEDNKLRLRVDRDHLKSIIEGAILGSLECVSSSDLNETPAPLQIAWKSVEKGVKIIIENPLEKLTAKRGEKIAEVAELTRAGSADRTKMEFLYWAVSSALLEHYHGGMIASELEGGGVRTTLAFELERMETNPSGERPIGGLRLETAKHGPETWVKLPFELNLLVVEDDPINRRLIAELLNRLGQKHTHSENGHEALELLAKKDHFDAILMDIDMPVLNGVSTTQALRMGEVNEWCTRIPIVAVTAFNSLSDESKYRKAGMNYFIPKPIGAEDLRLVLLDIRQKAECATV